MKKTYNSPTAFRTALEARLRKRSPNLNRTRQLLIFDRFLARVVNVLGDAVTLKGGLALELRLEHARSTKDIDLNLMGVSDVLAKLQQAAAQSNLGDYMRFAVTLDKHKPTIKNAGQKYEGTRYRAECFIAGQKYGGPFLIDVGVGEPFLGEPDIISAPDILAFIEVPPPQLRIYPTETHIAEKLHAYTFPYEHRENSRVKDLPDFSLLAMVGTLKATKLRKAIHLTFNFRNTHNIPTELPRPPATWRKEYADIALENGLPWPDLEAVFCSAQAFLNPVLAGDSDTTWAPSSWTWTVSI